ncbi:MAG: hypothetical protein J0H74_25775 [Chitinophagaceae bacterium]|nr:hypothetical protein [Chitinophagaceae bacterium]
MNNTLFPAVLLSLCCLLCIVFLVFGLRSVLARTSSDKRRQTRVLRITLLLLGGWILLLGVLALRGAFADFSKLPPRQGIAMLLPLPVVLWVAMSGSGKELLRHTPPHWILYLQSFRIIVELVLWLCVVDRLLPVQMSFEGRNFDILSGLLAIPVGYYCFIKKSWPSWVVLLYNIGGLVLLLNAVAIAVLSMPTPLRMFHNEPAVTLIVHFPFIYLPGFLVPLAYTLHIFSLRQWFMSRRAVAIGFV